MPRQDRRGDIDAIRSALRPRLGALGSSVRGGPTIVLPAHTHSADTITVEPAGNLAGDDVQEVLEEIDAEKLARDGSQTMLGALDMNHNSISNCADADVEGTATIGENVTLTGPLGDAQVSGVRQLHLTGDDADGEALVDGLERVVFNDEPTKSVIENPSAVQFNPDVTPGTHTTQQEGQASWSSLEHTLVADTDITAVRIPLGWVILRWQVESS
jgi:hypothetical protein